ncbi:MAG: polysaccharide deacetylase family protein [Defluviitaleaceae bacterium]|nr:polysaccharide deacetylase family protein [Defluviitaleaceae bacterium]
MNIGAFTLLRKVNRQLKRRRKSIAGEIMSPVRRIESVSPPKERVCAMTFDDGPTAAPCVPGDGGLTSRLLGTLKEYGATATFNVIGSTSGNYPDSEGKVGSHFVFGKKYDHYARFGQDSLAGALSQPELIKRMVDDGHEIANHGYAHRLFGPEYFVYRGRAFFADFDEVVADLTKLHDLIEANAGYKMRLARPPHYVDKIGRFGRQNAYDAYALMGYDYLAASFDGGGWYPSTGSYDADVRAMVGPMREALSNDPDCLNGAVIFQKDGYNMSAQSPVADALGLQLALLYDYGYRVVGVTEMLSVSPFEDVRHSDDCIGAARRLDKKGHMLGFKDNTFKPDDPATAEQLEAMCGLKRGALPKKRTSREILSPDAIRRHIANRFGDCPKLKKSTRRDACIAIDEALNNT